MYVCVFTQPLPHEQNVTQGQYFKQSVTGLNSEQFFLKTGCHFKLEEHSLPYY